MTGPEAKHSSPVDGLPHSIGSGIARAQAAGLAALTQPHTPGRHRHLIIASTAYHVLLAHLLAEHVLERVDCLLLLSGARQDIDHLHQALRGAAGSPFADVLYLAPASGAKLARERAEVPLWRELLRQVRPQRLFLFNDTAPARQALCREAQRAGVRTAYVEDGACAYSSWSFARPWRQHLRQALARPWLRNPQAIGATPWLGETYALYPEWVRPELRRRPVHPLPAHTATLAAMGWVDNYIGRLGVAPEDLQCEMLCTPGYSRAARRPRALREVLRAQIAAGRDAGLDVVVKYHPRQRDDFLDAAALGARTLPASAPVELVYLRSAAQLQRVCGDIGTSLMTARWIAPGAQVVSAMHPAGYRDARFSATLHRLGVDVL